MLMIDPHVHLRDWSQGSKETLEHGMTAGVLAGIGTFFDMPNTNPVLTDRQTIVRRLVDGNLAAMKVGDATGILPSYHVYAGVTADLHQVRDIVQVAKDLFPGVIGLKLFAGHSTGNMGLVSEELQRQVYETLANEGFEGVLAVHCEKEAALKPELWDITTAHTHSLARPALAEVESVKDQLRFAYEANYSGTLHICHVSTQGALEVIAQAREQGLPFTVTCGATAHHALLTSDVYDRLGNLVKMNPPLRGASDVKAIFQGLLDGSINWVESDHAPHTLEDKHNGASGIPGFAGTLLLIKQLRRCGCSEMRLQELFGFNAANAFGLPVNSQITVPSDSCIDSKIDEISGMYPWNPFSQKK